MKVEIDNILGVKLKDKTLVDFSKDAETVIEIPMHDGLLVTLEDCFYKRSLIVLDPIIEIKSKGTINVFSVNSISLCDSLATVKVVNVQE